MNRDNFFHYGTIVKTHGIHGEFTIQFQIDHPERIDKPEPVFIEINGLLVPFFIAANGLRFTTNSSGIIKFDDLTSETQAKEFVSCDLYLTNDQMPEAETGFVIDDLEGYTLIDSHLGQLGKIAEVHNNPKNPVLMIMRGKMEILIPFNDDLVESIDAEQKVLIMNLPQGLLDIYS